MLLAATYGDAGEKLSAARTFWVVPWRTLWPWVLFGLVVLTLAIVARQRFRAFWHVLKTGLPPPKDS